MEQQKPNVNKDLILREKLAIERTTMANDRTLLSFLRTALYFSIAGLSLNELLKLTYGSAIEISFYIIAAITLVAGIIKYINVKRKVEESKKRIGNYDLEKNE
jgi:putative membrane protein